jgi:hypothetical protein
LVLLPALSALLVLPLLRAAARLDKHYKDDVAGVVDHRTHAGLFLLYGLYAAVPCLVSAFSSRYRRSSVIVATCVLLVAGACELVVAVAPEPWFSF